VDGPSEVSSGDFSSQCERVRKGLLSYAYMCCGDLNLAEDIVQETMLIAFQKQAQYFPDADFMGWLVSIARHVWLRERDKRKMATRARQFIEQNATLFFDEQQYSENEWDAERMALRECLRKLPDSDQNIIAAHFSGRLKYEAIAESMGRTLSWVKVRMFRARAALIECVRRTMAQSERGGA
jgi:RNA polymerase sigma-70 factor (ECF subfamily)